MLKALRCILPVLGLGLICTLPLRAADAEPAPTPPTPPAGEAPTPPAGETPAPAATEPHVVTPSSGPGAADAARADAITEVAGVENAQRASDLFGYSFRLRAGVSAWKGLSFDSIYKSSTQDLRNQVTPDRIDWVRSLDAELEGVSLVPEIELCFGVYQYLRMGWYRYTFKGNSIAPQTYNYGDINYPGGTVWKGKGFLEQFDVLYEIALVKSPPTVGKFFLFEWRMGLGVKVVNYEFRIDATGALTRYNPTLPNTALTSVTDKDAQTLPIPIASNYIEICMGTAPARFGWFADTQWISTPKMVVNGDKFSAILADVKTGIYYHPFANVRIHVGYRYWHVDIGFEENGGQGRQVDGFSDISGVFGGIAFEY